MFIFIFSKIGKLQDNKTVRYAFEKMMFEKVTREGYCDIKPLMGTASITKSEIENKLRGINSQLAGVFSSKCAYAKTTEEIENTLLPILSKIEKSSSEEKLDEYSCFALVYYIFQLFDNNQERLDTVKELYKTWYSEEDNYNIKENRGIIYDANRVQLSFVSSMKAYLELLKEIGKEHNKLFYRGQCRASYDLIPSLFRKDEWLSNERKMYLELMAKCPSEFEKLESHIEKLAEMQHYGLPTRLLDVTENPLVALYFACEFQQSYRGEVIIFEQKTESIKYFQSDTVAVLASLPLFTKTEQEQFYQYSLTMASDHERFNGNIERLIHEIKLERPGFKSEINADDIRNAVICVPARKNRRIANQEGAFIVCGLLDEVYGDKKQSKLSNLRLKTSDQKNLVCIIDKKKDLIKELKTLGINKAGIYPEIDEVADYIKSNINDI